MAPAEQPPPGWGPGRWPGEKECLDMLRAAGCSDRVVEHLKMVERIALSIADRIISHCAQVPDIRKTGLACSGGIDIELVRAGALLHDIGRGRTHGIRHAIEGAQTARQLGLPEQLVRIIERHIGAGIDANEAARLGLPSQDYIPLTIEEKIVAHADNLAGRHGKLRLRDVVADLEKKGVPQIIPRMEALHRELGELAGTDIDDIDMG